MSYKNIEQYFWIEYILGVLIIPILLITMFVFNVRYGQFFVIVLIARGIYRPIQIRTLKNKGKFENTDYLENRNKTTLIIEIAAVIILVLFIFLILQYNIFGFTSTYGAIVVLIFVLLDVAYNIYIFYSIRISKNVNT